MIPRETVDEVLARTDIEQVIGAYVTLKRAGSNLVGLCPFHSEKSPSFTVFPSDNSFYCFGCGVGGNVITFVRKYENLEFEDAVESLARRAGITVHRDAVASDGRRFDRNRFFAMNRHAARFFHARLFDNNPKAKAALSYLTDKRALSMATVKHFGLGYAPDNYDALTSYLRKAGYTDEEMTAGYLTFKSDNSGRCFDSFRNRVMFPIIDVSGNVIAFGGRVMDDSKPKYKNSSDTPVFKKSRNLFALNYARSYCSERMILCEGYMDVIALHAAGFPFAVATLGTAITPEQARMMTRYTKKVIISYDNDEAGQKAAARALGLFEETGMNAKVLKMSGAKDPDEYIRSFGAKKFELLLEESRTKFDYNMERVFSKYDTATPQGKIEACSELCDIIAGFSSSAEREIYVSELSKKLGIDAEVIRSDLKAKMAKKRYNEKKEESRNLVQSLSGFGDRVNPDYAKAPAAAKSEEVVLGLLLLYPEHRKRMAEGLLTEDDFYTAFGRRVFLFIRDAEENGGLDTATPDAVFTPDEVGRITRMKRARMMLTENGDAVFSEAVETLKREVKEKRAEESSMTLDDLDAFLAERRNTGETLS